VALGSAHAAPFDGMLVIAQTPQADQEKEKEKKPPQRPSPPPPQHAVVVAAVPAVAVVAAPHVRYSHPQPPPPQRTPFVFIYMDTPSIEALDANDSRTKCICCQRILGLCADPVAAYPVKTRSLR
jgi:hypothetical protein